MKRPAREDDAVTFIFYCNLENLKKPDVSHLEIHLPGRPDPEVYDLSKGCTGDVEQLQEVIGKRFQLVVIDSSGLGRVLPSWALTFTHKRRTRSASPFFSDSSTVSGGEVVPVDAAGCSRYDLAPAEDLQISHPGRWHYKAQLKFGPGRPTVLDPELEIMT